MAEVIRTLCAYEPFNQLISEITAILTRVRDVSSDIEDLSGAAKRLRAVLPPNNEAPENSPPWKRAKIATVVEGLNQGLSKFHEKLRTYNGQEAKGVLSKSTILKRKSATCIHKDAAHIKYVIVLDIETIEQVKASLIQSDQPRVVDVRSIRKSNSTKEKPAHVRELVQVRKVPNSSSTRGRRLSQESKHHRTESADSSPTNGPSPPPSPGLDVLGLQVEALDEHLEQLEIFRINLRPKTHTCQVLAAIVYPVLCTILAIMLWFSTCRHGPYSGFTLFIAYVVIAVSCIVNVLAYRHNRDCRCWPTRMMNSQKVDR